MNRIFTMLSRTALALLPAALLGACSPLDGDMASDGRILLASGLPLFQVGDHDILFVRGNGESACPLVGCEGGRYRVIRGGLYSDDGREILPDGSGGVRRGRPRALPELQSVRIGDRTLGLHASSDEGESGPSPDTVERSSGGE